MPLRPVKCGKLAALGFWRTRITVDGAKSARVELVGSLRRCAL